MNYESVMKLALERAFYFPSCEIYGDAQAGFWEYGPTGVSVKNKFLELWRRELVRRDRMIEIDGSQIMSKSVFEASGHLGNFADPIIKCKKCGLTFRADKLISEIKEKLKNKFITSQDILITRERHRQHLEQCVFYLKNFDNKNEDKDFDKAAEDLRLATRHLGMIVGNVDVEEILGSIFNDFCIGK